MDPLFRQLAKCVSSPHFQVSLICLCMAAWYVIISTFAILNKDMTFHRQQLIATKKSWWILCRLRNAL
jgi:hypothetical protein